MSGTKKRGRPKIALSDEQVGELEKLAGLHCTDREMAGWFGISLNTFKRLVREPKAAAAVEEGKGKGKISLRRTQFKLAENNAAMAIFLGKQYLDQRDVTRTEGEQHTEMLHRIEWVVLPPPAKVINGQCEEVPEIEYTEVSAKSKARSH